MIFGLESNLSQRPGEIALLESFTAFLQMFVRLSDYLLLFYSNLMAVLNGTTWVFLFFLFFPKSMKSMWNMPYKITGARRRKNDCSGIGTVWLFAFVLFKVNCCVKWHYLSFSSFLIFPKSIKSMWNMPYKTTWARQNQIVVWELALFYYLSSKSM